MQYTGTQLRVLWLTVDAVTDNSRLDAMEGLIRGERNSAVRCLKS